MISGQALSPSALAVKRFNFLTKRDDDDYRGEAMDWKHLLAYITGTVDQELLLRNEYLVTENRGSSQGAHFEVYTLRGPLDAIQQR